MKRLSQIGIFRPFAAALAVIGLVALFVLGYRSLAGKALADRDKAEPEPVQLAPPPPEKPPQTRQLLGFSIRHPLVITLIAVALVVLATMAYLPFSERDSTIDGVRHEPSEYDEFFTYSQMEAMTHFAKCDAMLYSTSPEEELENVKERMSIEVEFDSAAGVGASSQAGQYTRRVRTPEEIAETIRLASEFYERVNCK